VEPELATIHINHNPFLTDYSPRCFGLLQVLNHRLVERVGIEREGVRLSVKLGDIIQIERLHPSLAHILQIKIEIQNLRADGRIREPGSASLFRHSQLFLRLFSFGDVYKSHNNLMNLSAGLELWVRIYQKPDTVV